MLITLLEAAIKAAPIILLIDSILLLILTRRNFYGVELGCLTFIFGLFCLWYGTLSCIMQYGKHGLPVDLGDYAISALVTLAAYLLITQLVRYKDPWS